jgi:hypothetical protein
VAVGEAEGEPHSKRSAPRTGRTGEGEGERQLVKSSGNNMEPMSGFLRTGQDRPAIWRSYCESVEYTLCRPSTIVINRFPGES